MGNKERILIVEDDKHIAKLVKYNLDKAGFETSVAKNGEEALSFIDKEEIHLVILDIMLPGVDGFEVCKEMKKDDRFKAIPIIMLTAKGEETDRVVGFELGADDYVVKPFSPRELALRVKAILKRKKPSEEVQDIISIDKLKIDILRHKVTVNKKEIKLTLMEFNLLLTLIKRRGRVQSREKLLDDVWKMDSEVTTRTIDTHIKQIRHKLGKMGKLIETVRGLGYKFSDRI